MSMGLATILSLLNTVIKLPIIPAGPHSLLGKIQSVRSHISHIKIAQISV